MKTTIQEKIGKARELAEQVKQNIEAAKKDDEKITTQLVNDLKQRKAKHTKTLKQVEETIKGIHEDVAQNTPANRDLQKILEGLNQTISGYSDKVDRAVQRLDKVGKVYDKTTESLDGFQAVTSHFSDNVENKSGFLVKDEKPTAGKNSLSKVLPKDKLEEHSKKFAGRIEKQYPREWAAKNTEFDRDILRAVYVKRTNDIAHALTYAVMRLAKTSFDNVPVKNRLENLLDLSLIIAVNNGLEESVADSFQFFSEIQTKVKDGNMNYSQVKQAIDSRISTEKQEAMERSLDTAPEFTTEILENALASDNLESIFKETKYREEDVGSIARYCSYALALAYAKAKS